MSSGDQCKSDGGVSTSATSGRTILDTILGLGDATNPTGRGALVIVEAIDAMSVAICTQVIGL